MRRTVVLMYVGHVPSPAHLRRVRALAVGYDVVVATRESEAIAAAATAEVILGHRYLRQTLAHAPRVRWVQSTSGGIDHLPVEALKSGGITSTRSVFASRVIAQHAVTLAACLIRGVPDCLRQQRDRLWRTEVWRTFLPQPKVALIIGFGAIGSEIAQIVRVMFGVEVWALRRDGRGHGGDTRVRVLRNDNWTDVLDRVDLCFVAVPLTASTAGMLDAPTLARLPPHAVIVNVGRGGTIDTAALCAMLRSGRLGGAALDVVYEDRVPAPDDPIWDTPRLLLTPYVAARYHERAEDMEHFVEGQLRRYLAREPLDNVVQWES